LQGSLSLKKITVQNQNGPGLKKKKKKSTSVYFALFMSEIFKNMQVNIMNRSQQFPAILIMIYLFIYFWC